MSSSQATSTAPTTSAKTQQQQQQHQDDNPCWGSPTQCDLKDLLSQLSHKDAILYESDQYVVLNKPPDLRMDGPFGATVHKLLTYWYPPPSLLKLVNKQDDQKDSDTATKQQERLLQAVAPLSAHNSLPDNALRPCHQLDYATSGVLCLGRTQVAAAHASQQWEDRAVQKEYLAIVQGSLLSFLRDDDQLHQHQLQHSLPQRSHAQLQSTLQQLERQYKHSKRKRPLQKDTFQGFQPPHSLFQKYKAAFVLPPKKNSKNKKRHRPSPIVSLTEDDWHTIWKPVHEILVVVVETSERSQLEGLDWKGLCKAKGEWKRAFQEAATIHNNLLRAALQKQAEEEELSTSAMLPTIFREEPLDDNEEKDSKTTLYISCPLAQGTDGGFGMKIPPSVVEAYPHMKAFMGPPGLDYKPSVTKCTLLHDPLTHSSWSDSVVTKVKLMPLTGRRHQLRVHMALLGSPILGDATYGGCDGTRHRNTDDDHTAADPSHDTTAPPRMCLHAHQLSLQLLTGDATETEELVQLVAPDPFLVEKDHQLAIRET